MKWFIDRQITKINSWTKVIDKIYKRDTADHLPSNKRTKILAS